MSLRLERIALSFFLSGHVLRSMDVVRVLTGLPLWVSDVWYPWIRFPFDQKDATIDENSQASLPVDLC